MKLNHLHLSVPNAKEASDFYMKFFAFRFAFSEYDGKMIFLRDEAGFLLALHDLKEGETVQFPAWHHFGFCVETKNKVKETFEKMKSAGIEFASEYKEDKHWASFYCWAPGPYKLEVS
jgi:catechol 2,3-dioxygenase-like lactoylglutathione lyase family enzyme